MYKKYLLFLFFFFPTFANAATRTGLDEILISKSSVLSGKRIGLIVNQTSRTASGEYGPDLFLKQKHLNLVALFTPEHGLQGIRKAGVNSDTVEKYHGIPVYSLYGSTRKPTGAMLRNVDVLVFDIQDIGVRAYTYLSTMILAMEAAAEMKTEFIVLDRPNPLGGERIEGNILDTALRSFVGQVPIPYIHGMTLGEIATMAKGERWFKSADKLKLTIISMQGWKRSTTWDETGLNWIAPSPNVPTYENAVGAAMFGAIGELGVLSIGISSDKPFLRLGSRLINGDTLLAVGQSTLSNELQLKREDFTVPFGDSIKSFNGISVTLPNNIEEVSNVYEGQFILFASLLKNAAFRKAFEATTMATKLMFEKVTGTTKILDAFRNGSVVDSEMLRWRNDTETFRRMRKKYLLYK